MVQLGHKAPAEQFRPRELVEFRALAEAHGRGSATMSDHCQPRHHNGTQAPFSIAWVAALGERWIAASTPDDVVAKIRPHIDAGLNRLVFHVPGHDQKGFLELFDRDLAPRLRGLA